MITRSVLRFAALAGTLLVVLAANAHGAETAAPGTAPAPRREATFAPLGPRLTHPPLRGRLVLNGGFGDYRGGHFHAGFDFGTARRTGRAVRAPEGGWIERVRSSGVGYGRALYLRTRGARLLEFGHLDAFTDPIAAYVDSAKVSSGNYEQDLWPARDRFRVNAGAIIAWTGESGGGGPHLHFEVRRDDVAYHPVRAGLTLSDRTAPTLVDLTLEPLDDASLVEGSAAPVTVALSGRDTLSALGRLRAVVRAYDRVVPGGSRVSPWRVGVEWAGRLTECRFDSVSWATDMVESDYVFDTGRVVGERGLVLWAPARFRPAVMVADAPRGEESGTIEVRPGDTPRTLRVYVHDLGGGTVSRTVVLRPGKPPPTTATAWWRGETPWSDESVGFTSLPGGHLRMQVPFAAAKGGVTFQAGDQARRATRGKGDWAAAFSVRPALAERSTRLPLAVRVEGAPSSSTVRAGNVWARRASPSEGTIFSDSAQTFRVDAAAGALFEDAVLLAFTVSAGRQPGLTPRGNVWRVEPATLPLRRAVRLSLVPPAGASREKVGVYRRDTARWQWIGAATDSATMAFRGETRRLGAFALFRDTDSPRVNLRTAPVAPSAKAPYSRWAVEASVSDAGSGIDGSRSFLEVDGRRVPTEWDPEAGVLRWRPLRPPARGVHRVVVVAADRAGNTGRATGTVRRAR